jgi:hypothetical protein
MSTRSQIIIKEERDEQWFYRHSDGYPSGNMPELYKFMKWISKGKIRRNVEQSCGWLVLIGAEEYKYEYIDGKEKLKKTLTEPGNDNSMGWKCGAYEICPCKSEHGDIEWLYTINLKDNSISIRGRGSTKTFSFEELKEYETNWEFFEEQWK